MGDAAQMITPIESARWRALLGNYQGLDVNRGRPGWFDSALIWIGALIAICIGWRCLNFRQEHFLFHFFVKPEFFAKSSDVLFPKDVQVFDISISNQRSFFPILERVDFIGREGIFFDLPSRPPRIGWDQKEIIQRLKRAGKWGRFGEGYIIPLSPPRYTIKFNESSWTLPYILEFPSKTSVSAFLAGAKPIWEPATYDDPSPLRSDHMLSLFKGSFGSFSGLLSLLGKSNKGEDNGPCCRSVGPSKEAIPTWKVPFGIFYVFYDWHPLLWRYYLGKVSAFLCAIVGGLFILTGYKDCHPNYGCNSENINFQHNLEFTQQKHGVLPSGLGVGSTASVFWLSGAEAPASQRFSIRPPLSPCRRYRLRDGCYDGTGTPRDTAGDTSC